MQGVLREVWYNKNNYDPDKAESRIVLRDFDAPIDMADGHLQRLTSYLQVNYPCQIENENSLCEVIFAHCSFLFVIDNISFCHYGTRNIQLFESERFMTFGA